MRENSKKVIRKVKKLKNGTAKGRDGFSGKLGFVLAAAGSAVGLGNIWRFPYLAAEYGGGIFLLVYILMTVTLGFSLMVAEIAIGRKTGQSAIGAFGALDGRFSFLGYISIIGPVLILPYYSVVGGWVMRYAAGFIVGEGAKMAGDGFFDAYVSDSVMPVVWFCIFAAVTALIVLLGVEKGIEKVSKVMMPALVVIILFVTIYVLVALPEARAGVVYYLKPDLSRFSVKTLVAAMGQLFYSMSLAMGTMITFGSYMKRDVSIEKAAHNIEIFDTGIAFLSGLMIIPAVFAFSAGTDYSVAEGPGLMFVTLPKLFTQIPGGAVVGGVFFVMVLLAALTSAIAMMETVVSALMDKLRVSRAVACLLILLMTVSLGVPASLGYSIWSGVRILGFTILEFFDFISNNLAMPTVAIITCIFVGYVIKPREIIEEVKIGGRFRSARLFSAVIRYVAPVCIFVILLSSLLDVFGVITI